MEKIEFKNIKSDNRLTKLEIKEVEQLSKDQEKLKILTQTNIEFKNFINADYRYANEGYLRKNGKTVKNLQVKLWFKWKDADWIFWKNTFFAFIKYQKENWLKVDWLAWNNTQAKLFGTKKLQQTPKRKKLLENNWDKFNAWSELASFIEEKGHSRWLRWQCWANVWNILLQSWIKWLPNSWRDWYKWTSILEWNPNFTKERISSPSDAKEWWILVYDQWYWNRLRNRYGHVEIALWNWKYYDWFKRKYPWWSIDARYYKSWFTGIVYYPKKKYS